MSLPVSPATSAEPSQRANFGAWWMLGVLFSLYVFSFLDRFIISMMVTPIKDGLHLTDFEMGLILGPAFAVFYAIFGLPLGWAADRFSRRWVIFLGVSLFGLATAASGLATSFEALFLARMLVGVGEASLSPAAYSLLADRFPRNLITTAMSIYTMGIKVGSASAFAVGGIAIAFAADMHISLPLVGALQPWQFVFLLVGVPAVLLALLVFTFREPPRTAISRKPGVPSQNIFAFIKAEKALMIPLLIGFSLISLCSYSLNGWVPTYLTREFGLEPIQYGPVLAAISMTAALTLVFKGAFVDWLFSRGMKDAHIRFYTWLLIGSVPVAVALFLVKDSLIFMILYGAIQIVAIPIIAYMSAAIQIIAPGNLRGQLTAVFLFCLTVLGGGAGPMLVAAITDYVFGSEDKLGYSLALVICTTIPLALISLRFALKPLREAVLRTEERLKAAALSASS